jgi:hypothetical protein
MRSRVREAAMCRPDGLAFHPEGTNMETNATLEETRVALVSKVVDSCALERVCRKAEKQGFDLGPSEKLWRDIDWRGRHVLTPIALGVILSGDEAGRVESVRCRLLAKVRRKSSQVVVLVDLPPGDFLGLEAAPAVPVGA